MGSARCSTRSVLLFAFAVMAIPVAIGPVASPVVSADCGRERASTDIRDYRGQAFTGRVRAIERDERPGGDWGITFDVDEVLSGAVPDPYVVFDAGGQCGTFHLEDLMKGERILASIGPGRDPAAPGHVHSVLLWRAAPSGWRFADDALWGGQLRRAFPPEARSATTLESITGLVGGPAITPIPASTAVISAQHDVSWAPVDGVLGGAVPGLGVRLQPPVVWGAGFWALEDHAMASWGDDEHVVWREPAVWRSSSGRAWQRTPLPRTAAGQLQLLPWGDRLALASRRYLDDPAGLDIVVWTRDEDHGWRRAGRLRVRPEGRFRGCAFTNQVLGATARTLVATASCLPLRGSGGSVGPGLGSAAAAQTTTGGRTTFPTYSWTSTDGSRWTSHRLFATSDSVGPARIAGLWPVGTGLAAWIHRATREDLAWSSDGARFTTLAALPTVDASISVDEVHDVALVPRQDGRVDWLALLAHRQHDAAHQPLPGTGINVWRLDPDGSWTVAQAVGGDATSGALATEGSRVAVVATMQVPGEGGNAYRRTGLSTDGGHTFVESDGPVDIDYECMPSLAMVGTTGITTCDEPGAPMTRWVTLWSIDGARAPTLG